MSRPRGRPPKLTPELQTKFCKLIAEEGLFRRHAAALVSVDEITVSRWMSRGASEQTGIYREFYLAVQAAEATFAQTGHLMLQASAATNPKQVQWLLSRRFPADYGRRDNVEQDSSEDKASKADELRELLTEKLERLFPEAEEPAPQDPTGDPSA